MVQRMFFLTNLLRGEKCSTSMVMYTHRIIGHALRLFVGVVPVVRVRWIADVTDAECEVDRVGGV